MNRTIETSTSILRKGLVTLVSSAALVLCGQLNALGQNTAKTVPMAAKFIHPTDPAAVSVVGNDGKGKYSDSESDVLCASAGEGFALLTTESSKSTRKA